MNLETANKVANLFKEKLNAPYIHVDVSTLGGENKCTVLIVVSADEKAKWQNGILHNSRYAMFHYNDKLEQFSKCYKIAVKFRKCTPKDEMDAVKRIQKFIDEVIAQPV